MSLKVSYFVLLVIEQGLLFGSSWVIYNSDTLITTRFVDFFIMMPHFFKMNSYSKANRDYFLEKKSKVKAYREEVKAKIFQEDWKKENLKDSKDAQISNDV